METLNQLALFKIIVATRLLGHTDLYVSISVQNFNWISKVKLIIMFKNYF